MYQNLAEKPKRSRDHYLKLRVFDLMDEMDLKRGDFHIFQNEYILALKITLTFYNRLLKPTVLSKSGLLLNMPSSTLN